MESRDAFPADAREWRRFRALQLRRSGWSRRDIAEALGVSPVSVSRWCARARNGGPEALRARPGPGRPPRLTPAQKRLIPEFLWHGAEAYGFRGEVWTCARIALVIEEEFGVRYHKDHVGRLLKELGWTPQMPIRRAIQRDEQPSSAGAPRCGPTCESERGVNAGCWFSRTNRGSTCFREWSGPTLPKPRRRSSGRTRRATTCRSWAE